MNKNPKLLQSKLKLQKNKRMKILRYFRLLLIEMLKNSNLYCQRSLCVKLKKLDLKIFKHRLKNIRKISKHIKYRTHKLKNPKNFKSELDL